MAEMKLWDKVKNLGRKCVNKVKEDPLGTALLLASVGLSAYSAVSTVKRGDELRLIPTASSTDSEETDPVSEEPEDIG